jgi:hypothetical protein
MDLRLDELAQRVMESEGIPICGIAEPMIGQVEIVRSERPAYVALIPAKRVTGIVASKPSQHETRRSFNPLEGDETIIRLTPNDVG